MRGPPEQREKSAAKSQHPSGPYPGPLPERERDRWSVVARAYLMDTPTLNAILVSRGDAGSVSV